jgi:hypothetical protein
MNWEIINLNYLLHDQQSLRYNVVQSIDWSVTKTSGPFTTERSGTVTLDAPGEVFVPYENIAKTSAINWVKNALGVTAVAELEAEMNAELQEMQTPTHGSGVPWTESGI